MPACAAIFAPARSANLVAPLMSLEFEEQEGRAKMQVAEIISARMSVRVLFMVCFLSEKIITPDISDGLMVLSDTVQKRPEFESSGLNKQNVYQHVWVTVSR